MRVASRRVLHILSHYILAALLVVAMLPPRAGSVPRAPGFPIGGRNTVGGNRRQPRRPRASESAADGEVRSS